VQQSALDLGLGDERLQFRTVAGSNRLDECGRVLDELGL
jgi:hypothetical protein